MSQRGQIWLLGDHRLMCGDATDPEDVRCLMGKEPADLWITDPPYNVDYTGGTKDALTIINDNMDDRRFRAFLEAAFQNAVENMQPGAAFYIWHADTEALNFREAAAASGLQVRQGIVWVKSQLNLGHSDYQWQHEPCLYGWKDGAAHYFVDDRTQTTVYEDARPDFRSMKKDEMRRLLEDIYADKTSTTVIHEDKPLRSAEHPTMKPVRLIARLVRNSSRVGGGGYGHLRRLRDDADRMRAARQEVPHDGAGSALRRRDHQTLGEADRRAGTAAQRLR